MLDDDPVARAGEFPSEGGNGYLVGNENGGTLEGVFLKPGGKLFESGGAGLGGLVERIQGGKFGYRTEVEEVSGFQAPAPLAGENGGFGDARTAETFSNFPGLLPSGFTQVSLGAAVVEIKAGGVSGPWGEGVPEEDEVVGVGKDGEGRVLIGEGR